MNDTFTRDFFIDNRARLREALPDESLLVVSANGLLQRNADNVMPFRQDSSFWYLTGLDEPDVLLVMDKAKEYLVVPPRDGVRAAFDGAIDGEALSARSGIGEVVEEAAGWERLTAAVKKYGRVGTLDVSASYNEQHGMYLNPARGRLLTRLREAQPQFELTDIRPQLTRQRVIKQAVELHALQQAIDVTIDGLRVVTSAARLSKYDYEYELQADLEREFRRRGAGQSFTSIVAAGGNAAQIHYVANRGAMPKNGLLLLDVGAEWSNYAGDISRTYALGKPSKRQSEVYEAVVEVQRYALDMLKPGTLLKEYEQMVEEFMGEKLRALGLIQTIDRESVRTYYPHAASHFLGLDVHDVGEYDRPLEPGMVITCEPGIYIPAEGIGVRIEDDVLITGEGHDVLSERLPRTLA